MVSRIFNENIVIFGKNGKGVWFPINLFIWNIIYSTNTNIQQILSTYATSILSKIRFDQSEFGLIQQRQRQQRQIYKYR